MLDCGDRLVELPVDSEDEAFSLVFEQPEVLDWWMAMAEKGAFRPFPPEACTCPGACPPPRG